MLEQSINTSCVPFSSSENLKLLNAHLYHGFMQNEPSNKSAILFFLSDEKGRILSAHNLINNLMSVVYCFSFFAIH